METQFRQLGDIILTIGSREFGPSFYSLFRELLEVDECTAFSFPDPAQASSVVVEGNDEVEMEFARNLALDYVSGGFLNDPNLKYLIEDKSNLRVIVRKRDEIEDSNYRQHYYDDANVSQELVVLGRVGGILYYTSFYRKENGKDFGDAEISTMNSLGEFMTKMLHRHSELVRRTGSTNLDFIQTSTDLPSELRHLTLEHLRGVLMSGPGKLSNREAEICAGIVMGYSTEAISLNCSISTNTVATHRKRAYAKLGISSQNELFLRYFSAVREFQSSLPQ